MQAHKGYLKESASFNEVKTAAKFQVAFFACNADG